MSKHVKKKLETLYIERDQLLEILNEVEKNIGTSTIPTLKNILDIVKGSKVLKESILFSEMKLKNDEDFFKRLVSVTTKYSKILPVLKNKVSEELPDTFGSNTGNVNIKIALSLVSEGIFLADSVTDIVSYIINTFYTKSGTEMEPGYNQKLGHSLINLIKLIPELEKANLNEVVDIIGNVPTINTLRKETTSVIPTDVVMGFISNTFKIKSVYTLTYIKRSLRFINFKKENKTRKINMAGKSFIGNPIFHIRLFLIDLGELRFERLKDSRRLMELRVLELRQKQQSGATDEKVTTAIKYYEEKLNKLDMKIERYLRG